MNQDDVDLSIFPAPVRTEPAKLYLISPQDVGGAFPDRLKAALEGKELRAKFEHLAAPVIGAQRAARLADAVRNLERCPNVKSLMQLAVPAKRS